MATVFAPTGSAVRLRPPAWHRPLLVLAAASTTIAAVAVVGMLVDPRQITGLSVWSKPLKFALSTAIYAGTLAWLIGLLPRFQRAARFAGTITALCLTVELVIITGFAVVGDTSHFNVSTPFHVTMWAVMAGSIGVVWVIALGVAILLFRVPLGDPARSLAIRAGAILAVVGMGLAFLMTGPTPGQLADYQGIAGAHTVGLADGGPGLPVLGWSTVGGDLRIPHFIGMHALQLLPIAAIVLELVAGRMPLLADARTRFRVLLILALAYAGAIALVTWQALAGQSIVAPAGPILAAGVALAIATIAALAVVLYSARRRPQLTAAV
jgi:hypothetical protein